MITIDHGYAIQYLSSNNVISYYSINENEDWVLGGEESEATIFSEESEAKRVVDEEGLSRFTIGKVKVVEVTRATVFYEHPITDKQLAKLKSIVND